MGDDELSLRVSRATGQAMFTSVGLVALWRLLAFSGVVGFAQSAEVLDEALLSLERYREIEGGDPAAVDHARAKIEELIRQIASSSKP